MNEITVYTNEQCPYCKQIKEELSKNNIEFEERLTKDYTEEWQEVVNLTGIGTVPTVKYDDEFFVPGRDFQNAQHLTSILETFKSSPYTQSRRTLERIKTFNYNINIAFGRLDQLLRQIETNTKKDEHKSTS